MIDLKYKDLALTRENSSVNIINMSTGKIIKIADVPDADFFSDNMMQIITKSNVDTFSFVIIGREDLFKYTVRKSLLDLCLTDWKYFILQI